MKSQNKLLGILMRKQWVSPADALAYAGCMRLAARVRDLRDQGETVDTRWAEAANGKRWKEYRIS